MKNPDVQKCDHETAEVILDHVKHVMGYLMRHTSPDLAMNVLTQALSIVICETVTSEHHERQILAVTDGLRMQIAAMERKGKAQH